MRFKLYQYKRASLAAKKLATALGVLRVRPTYDAKRRDVIINWGNSVPSNIIPATHDLNKPESIARACNKLLTFNWLNGNGFEHIPDYTAHKEEAEEWLQSGYKIYCRKHLTGHSGSGIVVASTVDELVDAPLYTKATKHKHEYRVHVFKGEVIDVQQKKKKLGYSGPSTGIRNHASGYIFARCDIHPPACVLEASVSAVNLLGLDFGAADVGYRERDNRAFVFEVNTAPGIEGTTVDKYATAFNSYLRTL